MKHPIAFGQREGGETMAIHARSNVAVTFLLILDDEVDGLLNVLGIRSVIGVLSVGEEGHDAESNDSGFAAIVSAFPGALGILILGKPL